MSFNMGLHSLPGTAKLGVPEITVRSSERQPVASVAESATGRPVSPFDTTEDAAVYGDIVSSSLDHDRCVECVRQPCVNPPVITPDARTYSRFESGKKQSSQFRRPQRSAPAGPEHYCLTR